MATLAAVYGGARCCAYVPIVEGFGLPGRRGDGPGNPGRVASPVPSSGGASLEVDPTDVSSIADGLVAAACDEATRAALVASGRARAARLRWVDAARAHVAIWEQAAAEPGRSMSRAPGDAALEVALDVSAVPERDPPAPGATSSSWRRALAKTPRLRPDLVARRDDAASWAQIAPDERVSRVAPGHRLVASVVRAGAPRFASRA